MANKKGTAIMIVGVDVPADKEGAFNNWYNEEHLPELLAVPGFLSAARYEAVKSGPKYLACYELENPRALETDAFKDRRAGWAQGVNPRAIGTNRMMNVYQMIHPAALTPEIAQSDTAPVLQIGRMDIPPEHEDEWNQWYSNVYVPNYEKVPGVIRGRRWKAVRGEPQYTVVYELEHETVPESEKWARQRDIDPGNARMRSLMRHAPGSPGIWKKISPKHSPLSGG